jgi:hypothetical protein
MNNTPAAATGDGALISYVWVPADSSRPLQELTLARTRRGDLLVEHLKAAFAGTAGQVDISLLQQQSSNLLGSSNSPTAVSDKALKQVSSEASVEVFTMVHPAPSNKFTSIHLYLDEVGMLKRLPLNPRASAYATRAGFVPAPVFYGDVFLGRVSKQYKAGGGMQNVSFSLGVDTAMDAPWLVAAMNENLEHQMQKNRITGRTGDLQPAVAGSDGAVKEEEGFGWTQTEEELEVTVSLPTDTDTKKDLEVKFRPQSLQVLCKKKSLVHLKLFERVEIDSCTWTIDRGAEQRQLVITMEKLEQAFWPRIQDW